MSSGEGRGNRLAPEADEPQVVVGRVAGVFGVKGWIRVFSYTDPPDNILKYRQWRLDAGALPVRVKSGAAHGRGVIAQLEGIDDRDVARALIGREIRIGRGQFRPVGADQYYWSDLMGLAVIDTRGVSFGTVVDLMETGANDVLVVEGERRRLVPFLTGTVIRSVDLDARRIEVDWDADF
jgi:16S rRNA processing protein RimM